MKRRTQRGDDIWQLPELGVLLVVKFQNSINVAVTCIPNVERDGYITEEERERWEEYRKRIADQEKALREEQEAKEREIRTRLNDKQLDGRRKAEAQEELANTVAVYRKKLQLHAEERGLVKDLLGKTRVVRDQQATAVGKLEKALKIAVKFLMEQRAKNPRDAGSAMEEIGIIDDRYLHPDFYGKL